MSATDEYVIALTKDEWTILGDGPVLREAVNKGAVHVAFDEDNNEFLVMPTRDLKAFRVFLTTVGSNQNGRPAEMRLILGLKAIYADIYKNRPSS